MNSLGRIGRMALQAAVILSAAVVASSPRAQGVAEFYKGKQIRMIVGTAAGQDYDIWARILARHLGRHIPGNPTFVVENMPGAGHIIAANHLFNIAARDGTVLGMTTHSIVDSAVLETQNARFDPLQFSWIGSPQFDHRALFVDTRTGIKHGSELFERELIVGATAPQQTVTMVPILLKNLLGMKLRIIQGYKSPNDVALALDRGEVGALIQAVGSATGPRRRDWLDSGKMRALFTMEQEPVQWLKSPTVFEFAKTDEQRSIFTFLALNLQLWRPVFAPPGVPADRLAALRAAFDRMIDDEAFKAEATGVGFDVSAWNAAQVEQRVRQKMATPKDMAAKVAAALAH
jgi:tripartite-type tricarboxylate transporter receptor subunit TctC